MWTSALRSSGRRKGPDRRLVLSPPPPLQPAARRRTCESHCTVGFQQCGRADREIGEVTLGPSGAGLSCPFNCRPLHLFGTRVYRVFGWESQGQARRGGAVDQSRSIRPAAVPSTGPSSSRVHFGHILEVPDQPGEPSAGSGGFFEEARRVCLSVRRFVGSQSPVARFWSWSPACDCLWGRAVPLCRSEPRAGAMPWRAGLDRGEPSVHFFGIARTCWFVRCGETSPYFSGSLFQCFSV